MRNSLIAISLIGALALAACGDDSTDSPDATADTGVARTGSAASASTDQVAAATTGSAASAPSEEAAAVTDVASATALVERFSQPVTSVGVAEPASRKPDPGKKIVFLECPVPTCKVFGDGIEEATNLLDWELTRLTYQFTPEGQQSAFQQALDLAPGRDRGRDPVLRQLRRLRERSGHRHGQGR